MIKPLPVVLLCAVLAAGLWSGVHPHHRWTWLAEVFPVIIVIPLLIVTYKKFPLTALAYCLIAIHCCVLIIGGHYTYALTPIGDWLRDVLNLQRNPYDRIGHFAQGFIPAIIIRELLLRTSPLKPGKWLFAIAVFCCMGISAAYELIEWVGALVSGSGADQFLATQGDVWDTQKDMALAGIGAIISLTLLSRVHDRQLSQRKAS